MTDYPNFTDFIRNRVQYLGADPNNVVICDGSDEQTRSFCHEMEQDGSLIRLNEATNPDSFLYPPNPNDVARSVERTFMVGDPKVVGSMNNPMSEDRANGEVWPLFNGVMGAKNGKKAKRLLVVPYALGPMGSPVTEVGVQLTDAPLIPVCVSKLYTMGPMPLAHIYSGKPHVRATHAVADLDPSRLYILHLPASDQIWSINSASAGGNVILAKKGHGLRLGSIHARREGWLAEHVAIFAVKWRGKLHWFAAALPSACGKTTLATSHDAVLGDDLGGMFIGHDGRLYAVARERGIYCVLKNTNLQTNPVVARMLEGEVVFMGTARTPDGRPWWTGCGWDLPPGSTAWDGRPIEQLAPGENASHDNARGTVSMDRCELVSPLLGDMNGVPLSGIIFGGRRREAAPLVYRSMNWQHGVYVGATMISETTAATTGKVGVPKRDPMAMGPFLGYDRADYFGHWLGMGRRMDNPPPIYHVNWFRQDGDGEFIWPGFDANRRVLEYMCRVAEGTARERQSFLGFQPEADEIDVSGLSLSAERVKALHAIDPKLWLKEAESNEEFLLSHGDNVPTALTTQNTLLRQRIQAALNV